MADPRDPDRTGAEPSNPYAPPESDLGPGPHYLPSLKVGGRFSASEVLGETWELYKARMGLVVGVVLAGLVINVVYQLAGDAMASTVDQASPMAAVAKLVFSLAGMVLQIWISGGQALALLRIARGEDARVTDIFQGGPYVLRIIGASLLLGLGFLGIALACLAPAGLVAVVAGQTGSLPAIILLILGTVVAVVISFMISVRFYQYTLLIIDRDAGAIESLRLSYQITRGHSLELIGLTLMAAVISISGVLLFCVGFFLTVAFSSLLFACIYVALVGEPISNGDLEFLDDPDFPEFTR